MQFQCRIQHKSKELWAAFLLLAAVTVWLSFHPKRRPAICLISLGEVFIGRVLLYATISLIDLKLRSGQPLAVAISALDTLLQG